MKRDLQTIPPLASLAAPPVEHSRASQDAAAYAARERERLARDLHDGLLQFLTGISLQVQTLRRLADDAARVRECLARLHDHLTHAQRELRLYVEGLRSPDPAADGRASAPARVAMFGTLLAHQWNVRVSTRIMHPLPVGPELEHELLCLMSEGVANAVRHGRAWSVSVEMQAWDGELEVEIADDGQGFGFRGALDCTALRRRRQAPHSLCERVEALGGDLVVHCDDGGTRVRIRLPLKEADRP